jgi:hypothetical protein
MEKMSTLGGALLIYYFGADPVSLGETLSRTPTEVSMLKFYDSVTDEPILVNVLCPDDPFMGARGCSGYSGF